MAPSRRSSNREQFYGEGEKWDWRVEGGRDGDKRKEIEMTALPSYKEAMREV